MSIRYIGDNLDTLFTDCRAAIRTELVEKRGWTIREPYGNGPGKLTWLAIWKGIGEANANKTPDDLYADSEFGFGLNREERSLLQSIVREENGTVRITASDYDVIAKALSQYLTTGNTIVVSRERHSPPEYADIHLSVSSDQWENFTLHDETRETLERLKEQRREELRQETFSDLAETIASLKELNADKSAVKDRLSTALSDTYNGLRVMENSEIRELRQRARTERSGYDQSTASKNRLIASLKTRPKLLVLPILLVAIVLGAIFLIGFGGLPFLDWNNGSDNTGGSSASFSITNVSVEPPEAVVGDEININVTVKNGGEDAGNATVFLHSEESLENDVTTSEIEPGDTKKVDFSVEPVTRPQNYSVRVENDSSTERDIRVDINNNITVSDSIAGPNLPTTSTLQTAKSAAPDSEQARQLTIERFKSRVTIDRDT